MEIALVGQQHVLRGWVELQAHTEQVLPREVERHVVLDDVDQDAALLPVQRDALAGALAVVDHGEGGRHVRAWRPGFGPAEALQQLRHEGAARIATAQASGKVQPELAKRGLQRALAATARRRRRATLTRDVRGGQRSAAWLRHAANDSLNEHGLLAPSGIQPKDLARALQLVTAEQLEQHSKVERALSHERINVGARRPAVAHFELESGRELRKPVSGEKCEDRAAIVRRESSLRRHDRERVPAILSRTASRAASAAPTPVSPRRASRRTPPTAFEASGAAAR